MGERYTLDSNALIDYVDDKLPVSAALVLDRILDSDLNVSVIVKIEVLGFDGQVDQMRKIEGFLALATTFYVDDEIAEETIRLRKFYKKVKLPDAIIAATALVHGFTIITRNTSDFKNIDGLRFLNPHEMA